MPEATGFTDNKPHFPTLPGHTIPINIINAPSMFHPKLPL